MKQVSLGTVWSVNQPPTQLPHIINKVDRECYAPVFRELATREDIKVNIAINKSVEELLVENGRRETLDMLVQAVRNGTVEILGGFAYHPLAPIIMEIKHGKDVLKRQNELNHKHNKKIFGNLWNPEGFYLPEFAYSDDVGKLLVEMGYKFTITNGTLYYEKNKNRPIFNHVLQINGLDIFLTSDWSRKFAMEWPDNGNADTRALMHEMFSRMCGWFGGETGYTVWGYDIETIGHQQKRYGTHTVGAIAQGSKEEGIELAFLSDLRKRFDYRIHAEIFPGTQSTEEKHVHRGIYWPLWAHPNNPMHKKINEIESIAIQTFYETVEYIPCFPYKEIVEDKIDRNVYSCKSWQANPRHKHFIVFLIKEGINPLIDSAKMCSYALEQQNRNIEINNKTVKPVELRCMVEGLKDDLDKMIWKEEQYRS